jgi:hypothetical protein
MWFDVTNDRPLHQDGLRGELLWFDTVCSVHYVSGLVCAVGETVRDVTALRAEDGKISVVYTIRGWNSGDAKTVRAGFTIAAVTPGRIVLFREKAE